MKMVYIASPFSHKNFFVMCYRFYKITKIAALLYKKHKVCMFLPITQSGLMQVLVPSLGGSFASWKDVDLAAIDHCDEVWVVKMSGWDKSIGVIAEVEYARENNTIVRFINPDTLETISTLYPKRHLKIGLL